MKKHKTLFIIVLISSFLTSFSQEVTNKDIAELNIEEPTFMIGQLNTSQLEKTNEFLTKSINKDHDINIPVIIHFFDGKNEILTASLENKRYWKWIKKNSKKIQSYLIVPKGSNITPNQKNHLHKDDKEFLKKLFFENSNFEINHVYIKPNGEVKIFYGNEDIIEVLDFSI